MLLVGKKDESQTSHLLDRAERQDFMIYYQIYSICSNWDRRDCWITLYQQIKYLVH